jgi:hypothetical protein
MVYGVGPVDVVDVVGVIGRVNIVGRRGPIRTRCAGRHGYRPLWMGSAWFLLVDSG